MGNTLKNDFSWSLQRVAMFERCKREYYCHYYGSWEGWEKNADEKTKILYGLKNIRTESSWLKSIIDKTFYAALRGEIEFTLASCKGHSVRDAHVDLFELERKEYLSDPKKFCLDTVYFSEVSV